MELRVLRYFPAVAREESISAAAETLHLTQPTLSRQSLGQNEIYTWLGRNAEALNIVTTYNLIYNAALMVEEGMGYALTLDRLVNTVGDSKLCFRPLEPRQEVGLDIVWKKYQVFSRATEKFLEHLQEKFMA